MESQSVCDLCIAKNGGCCVDVEFSIHKSEIAPFLAAYNNGEFGEHSLVFDKKDDTYTYTSNEEPCLFLSEDNRCTIYNSRPLMCRMYPILWKNRKKRFEFYLDVSCPLSHHLPLREFTKWPKKANNMIHIEIMDELDFKRKDDQYINLTVIEEQPDRHLVDSTYLESISNHNTKKDIVLSQNYDGEKV